jgi:protein-tyrosine phosphatase
MIDLHCHVLPGVDDGPATLEESVALVGEAYEDGTRTIAATPHVDWSHTNVNVSLIRAGVRVLQERLDAAGVHVTIVPGAEVASTRALELDDADLRELTLGGGGWLLLECPIDVTHTPGFAGIARLLARRGHRLLLAHPERCPLFLRSPDLLEELVADGMLAQVTAEALAGRYGRTVRDAALQMVKRGTAHVVASDGHGAHRPAKIASELSRSGFDPGLAGWLARDVPAALLAGGTPPPRPPIEPPAPRKRLRLLRA